MNQRDSSGLPLRAMVMVLLFLGVVFLLVAFQAMKSDGDDDAQAPLATTTMSTTPTSTSAAPHKAEVRVFNISTVAGAAEATANRLREAGWHVTETGNLELPDVTASTVYFSDAPGEKGAAEEVGKLLQVPVQPRTPALAEQPPGVVVVVTG
ncbi:LytR C-terminal domain-containing protein [Mycobacterium sp. E740]|uniref:LytR C-terminal domain-containing protein n=1 Tax=Mycobacterium sp. E740 TaxID=1834149 RepID=UPI000AE21B21|nr:LytR C-terminal domain-containing protein [Mycobacterium sp. E740]